MRKHTRYKIAIEDESRLETVASHTASSGKWIFMGAAAAVAVMALGAFLVFLTPVRTLLPGYLKESERAAGEMQILRLDSLKMAYETNALFLDNIINVLNPVDTPIDTTAAPSTVPLSPDSLLPTSEEELKFVEMMRERDKYNISVVAPLAAESLMFSPVNEESVFTESSKNALRGEVILARGVPVTAIADGTVIAVSQSIREGGSNIIIQHPKGFLSRLSRLGTVIVGTGDKVTGGQVIALPGKGNARKGELIYVEMWHNGEPLVPYEYIGDKDSQTPHYPKIDEEVGRGRF